MIENLTTEQVEAARKVRLLLLDSDGVLTDGRLYFGSDGEQMKVFDVQDGQGIVTWMRDGFRAGIISGRDSPIVGRRAAELGISIVRQGVRDKLQTAVEIIAEMGCTFDEAAFVGDDVPDIELIRAVGFGVAVANAVGATKDAAKYVTQRSGGRGAVREVVDLLLAARALGG